jgi:acetolactate synthase-1/2/3 large subunit
MIKWKQEAEGFENFGLDYGNPDFVTYGESFGAVAYRPESTSEFIEVLHESLNGSGVHLIDLPVDYSLNHSILNVLIKESSCVL